MPRSLHPQPASTLDHLDRAARQLPRQHARILDLDAFHRRLDGASGQPTSRRTAHPADAHTNDTETQLGHKLNLAFADLGGAAFALAHHGSLNDNRLAPQVQRIHQLYAQLDTLDHNAPASRSDHIAHARTA